jgi:hypothetical protein
MKKVAPARPTKQAPRGNTLKLLQLTSKQAESLKEIDESADLISGVADVLHEQIDEYENLLEELVEKVTGRALWGDGSLATDVGRYDTLNRKASAISYLLIMLTEKASVLQGSASTLRRPVPATAPKRKKVA